MDVVNIPAHWVRGDAGVVTLQALRSGQPARPGFCPERARETNSANSSSHFSGPYCVPQTLSTCSCLILTTTQVAQDGHMLSPEEDRFEHRSK